MKKTAYINGVILDGTETMTPLAHHIIVVEDGVISDILEENAFQADADTKVYDLAGRYVTPGLINLHVHLPGNGGASKKPRDNKKLVGTLMKHGISRKIVKELCAKYAAIELYSGVTTIRCVGGIEDFDSQIRDEIQSGRRVGPRMLVSNCAITVPGGHMEGSVASAVTSAEEARARVQEISKQHPDLIKLMITGGVMDGTVKGEPGQLKMQPEIIRAACEEAHALGYPVAAHVEGREGLIAALENGVDTIEHGADPDESVLELFRAHKAALVTTISPAVPYAEFNQKDSYATDMGKYNGRIVLDGIVNCSKKAMAAEIPVGLGNDVGCPFITQYNFWRELEYFTAYCGVSNQYALYTATLRNAQIAGISDQTGSIEPGKSADFLVMDQNPLEDLHALSEIRGLCFMGTYMEEPLQKIRKNEKIDRLFDR